MGHAVPMDHVRVFRLVDYGRKACECMAPRRVPRTAMCLGASRQRHAACSIKRRTDAFCIAPSPAYGIVPRGGCLEQLGYGLQACECSAPRRVPRTARAEGRRDTAKRLLDQKAAQQRAQQQAQQPADAATCAAARAATRVAAGSAAGEASPKFVPAMGHSAGTECIAHGASHQRPSPRAGDEGDVARGMRAWTCSWNTPEYVVQ